MTNTKRGKILMLHLVEDMYKWIRVHPAILGGIATFGIPLSIYAIFPNKNYGQDAIHFMLAMGGSNLSSLFHPHHLIYNALGFVLSQGLAGLGISISIATLMQTLNSVFAAAGVLLFFIILLRLSKKVTMSVTFALLLAFCMGVWDQAIEVEVYACGLVFLTGSLLLIIDPLSNSTGPKPAMVIGLGILGSLAILFHQMHILFVAIGCTFIIFAGKGVIPRLKMLGYYAIPFPLLVVAPYIAVGYAINRLPSLVSFYNWLTSYTQSGQWGHFGGLKSVVLAAAGLNNSFFGKTVMITGSIGVGDMVLEALYILGVILVLGLVVVTIVKFKAIYESRAWLVTLMLVWIVVYGLFTLWWDPSNVEFWMHILPPLWLLLFLGFEMWRSRQPNWKKAIPIVLLCLLVCVNLVCWVMPNSDIENNDTYQLVNKLHDNGLTSEDLVLAPGPGGISCYYRLYFGSYLRTTSLSWYRKTSNKQAILEDVRDMIKSTLGEGSRVLVSGRELNPARSIISTILEEDRLVKTLDQAKFYASYQDRLVRLFRYKYGDKEDWMFELTATKK